MAAPLELDEEIYVAIGSVGPFQDRSEYGQATDVMPAAKRSTSAHSLSASALDGSGPATSR